MLSVEEMAAIADPAAVARTLDAIRARAPLVHNLTGAVVANVTANALLAIGATPAMMEEVDEVGAFVARTGALVINLGTLTTARAEAMRVAAAAARRADVLWVLDPVAVGAVPTRRALACELMALAPTAIRGNASEIRALAGDDEGGGRGPDSQHAAETALDAARALAGQTGAAVAITGAVDYATDGARTIACANGHPMMTRVTGSGCTATAIVGACLAVERTPLAAVAHALALVGVAGEIAVERSRGPGSLQSEMLDALYTMDAPTLGARTRLSVC